MHHHIGRLAAVLVLALAVPSPAQAHFLELIPSSDIIAGGEVTVELTFTHPMERGPAMEMAEPVAVGVLREGMVTDLENTLKPRDADGKRAWEVRHKPEEPGDYVYFAVPAPYWEAGEGRYIIHYAKVVVDYASGAGWDALVGLPLEIQPLARPYGLWTGNLFRGVALKDGQPLPFAEVEVEWRNDGSVKPPSDPFITQAIKADAAGVFAYAMPRAGWWGFNVIADSDQTMTAPDGKPAAVELGGTMWVHTADMK